MRWGGCVGSWEWGVGRGERDVGGRVGGRGWEGKVRGGIAGNVGGRIGGRGEDMRKDLWWGGDCV